MENYYVAMKDLMNGPNSFTFDSGLEPSLKSVADRGHQSIFRVYVDYPSRTLKPTDGVPAYLVPGLKFFTYTNDGGGVSPDWTNQTLISAMVSLIEAIGRKYDGDNRIAFIQVGFLGHWGEWHDEVIPFASESVQNQILEAFDKSFQTTKILARYPDRLGTYLAPQLKLGFHDDSFGQDTLYPNSSWSFTNQLVRGQALNNWKNYPIGGEVRPESQLCIFAADPMEACKGKGVTPQDWDQCVQATHSSWQWDFSAFSGSGYPPEDLPRALEGALSMGYQFYIPNVTVTVQSSQIKIETYVWNKGNAPFYYPLQLKVNYDEKAAYFTDPLNKLLPSEQANAMSLILPLPSSRQIKLSLDSKYIIRPIVFAQKNAASDGIISINF
eukprot:TRINITY_DN9832_c0_g1_i1.p1 TRINITY_DN9832_c0_g1~~TRINITY_DN9832_c0_g1_i1.p1  ORF type:complete len:425 (+),score=68.04 TRINITY_DN9832_c0_g1_i1:127-1275(+)